MSKLLTYLNGNYEPARFAPVAEWETEDGGVGVYQVLEPEREEYSHIRIYVMAGDRCTHTEHQRQSVDFMVEHAETIAALANATRLL